MSRLTPADLPNVLDLIEAISMAGQLTLVPVCVTGAPCAYHVDDIITSLHHFFPLNTLTDPQITSLLFRGARSGVFGKYCASASGVNTPTCGSGVSVFYVNQNMVRVNSANIIYAAAFNRIAPKNQVFNVDPYIDSSTSYANTIFNVN